MNFDSRSRSPSLSDAGREVEALLSIAAHGMGTRALAAATDYVWFEMEDEAKGAPTPEFIQAVETALSWRDVAFEGNFVSACVATLLNHAPTSRHLRAGMERLLHADSGRHSLVLLGKYLASGSQLTNDMVGAVKSSLTPWRVVAYKIDPRVRSVLVKIRAHESAE